MVYNQQSGEVICTRQAKNTPKPIFTVFLYAMAILSYSVNIVNFINK